MFPLLNTDYSAYLWVASFDRESLGSFYVFQRNGELEPVFRIGADGQGLLFEALFFKKVCDASAVLFRNGRQNPISSCEIAAHYCRLVLENGEQQLVADDT